MSQINLLILLLNRYMKYCSLFCLVFIITACGYKMTGLSEAGGNYTYYISQIVNNSAESDYYSLMNKEIYHFFSNYNLLEEKGQANYFLTVTLKDLSTDTVISSSTRQAISSDISPILLFEVTDTAKNKVFSKEFTARGTYYVGSNLSTNVQNRYDAFLLSLREILLDFRHDFESAQRLNLLD